MDGAAVVVVVVVVVVGLVVVLVGSTIFLVLDGISATSSDEASNELHGIVDVLNLVIGT